MRPILSNSRQECQRRSTKRTNSRGNQAGVVHCRTPPNRNVHGNFLLSTMRKQRRRLVRRNSHLVENRLYRTCQTDANDNQEDERAQEILQKTCNKVDGRYETGLLWRDDSQLNFTITNSTPNAIWRPYCNALTRHLI